MKKRLILPRMPPRREFQQRARQILQELQKTLMPDHAPEIIAINVETGEYVLGRAMHEAITAFRARWPDQISYLVRVDGGPVTRFHGM
jgi:hypothetical protein